MKQYAKKIVKKKENINFGQVPNPPLYTLDGDDNVFISSIIHADTFSTVHIFRFLHMNEFSDFCPGENAAFRRKK